MYQCLFGTFSLIQHLFVYSFVDGHLGCFQFLAIANKAATNIAYKSSYGPVLSFLLGKYLGVGWIIYYMYVFFSKETVKLLSKVIVPFYILSSSVPNFSMFSPILGTVFLI